MFRLLKLSAYLLLGYAFYEFAVGLLEIEDEKYRRSNPAGTGRPSQGRRPEADRMNFTGPGEGQPVTTVAADGASASHVVGRGVVAG